MKKRSFFKKRKIYKNNKVFKHLIRIIKKARLLFDLFNFKKRLCIFKNIK